MAPRLVIAALALAAMVVPAAAEFVPLTMMQNDILRALGHANPKLKPKARKPAAAPAAEAAAPKPGPTALPEAAEAGGDAVVPMPRLRPAAAPETATDVAASEGVGGFKAAPPAPSGVPQFSEAGEGSAVGGYVATAPAAEPDDAALAYAPAQPPLPRVNPRLADAMANIPTGSKAAGKPIKLAALPPAADLGDGEIDMARLDALGVTAKALPAIRDGACGMPDPVDVTALDDGDVPLTGQARVNRAIAATFAGWVHDMVEPAAKSLLGGELTGLRIADSYGCRTRDHIKNAKLSEHAFGNAIDVSAFRIGKQWIIVGGSHSSDQQAFLDKVRAAACGPFKTVLGPGSDSYHAEHFHLALAHRRTDGPSRGLYCK